MKTFAEIIEIIKARKNLSNDADVAILLNMKPKTLATAKSRNSIPFEDLTSFCNKENLSLNWLLTGEGEMERGEARSSHEVVGDTELVEILEWLKENPHDKKLILKLIKGRKFTKEALEGLGIKSLINEEGV